MAGLHGPLPTLRPWPRGQTRTARGRRGSLLLRRIGLSPTTPGRSPGALPSPDEENPSPANPASSSLEPPSPLRFDRFRSLRLGISRIGMDTSKHIFQLHGVNAAERPVLPPKLV